MTGERRPRQERSRQTRERLLRAAAAVVGEAGVDGARVADIARRAGTSVGNVYRRFASKEALVEALETEVLAGRRAFWDDFLRPERWRERELDDLLLAVVREVVHRHRRHRELLRALATRARPEYEDRSPRVGGGPAARVTALVTALWPDRVRHPRPEQAVPLALEMAFAAVGELVLFRRGGPRALGLDDEALARELARAASAYLATPPEAAPGA